MSHNKDIEEITRYLSGEMTGQEKKIFEERLNQDPDLRHSLTLNNDIDIAIGNENAITFIDLVKQDLDKRKTIPVPGWWRTKKGYYGIAAVITLLITVGMLLVYFSSVREQQNKDILVLFQPTKIDFLFRADDRSDTLEQSFLMGIKLFNGNKYTEAAREFEQASLSNPASIQLKYYLGLSLIYSGKILRGGQMMENIFNSKDLIYSTDAKWQFIYCCIMQDSIELAKEYLNELSDDPYYMDKVGQAWALIETP